MVVFKIEDTKKIFLIILQQNSIIRRQILFAGTHRQILKNEIPVYAGTRFYGGSQKEDYIITKST